MGSARTYVVARLQLLVEEKEHGMSRPPVRAISSRPIKAIKEPVRTNYVGHSGFY